MAPLTVREGKEKNGKGGNGSKCPKGQGFSPSAHLTPHQVLQGAGLQRRCAPSENSTLPMWPQASIISPSFAAPVIGVAAQWAVLLKVVWLPPGEQCERVCCICHWTLSLGYISLC